ncbi:hypothetical protein [Pseudanabaena sp. PCC 6802]|nr:hypothetical protein [Pseudanabaena sp. PCC 6802]
MGQARRHCPYSPPTAIDTFLTEIIIQVRSRSHPNVQKVTGL